jgi:hypothetical protein
MEEFKNFMVFMDGLVREKFYGQIVVKFEDGRIAIGEKSEKIKFDNRNFLVYKSKNT